MSAVASFDVYPAIDVRGGRVVRLTQGDYAHETSYADEPLALARKYAEAGAHWLHLVDLDAARIGGYTLEALLSAIKASTGLRVQTGGGVRKHSDVERLLAAGADRVVIGSLAVDEPARVAEWLDEYGSERLVIAFDVREIDGQGFRPRTVGSGPARCRWTRCCASTSRLAHATYCAPTSPATACCPGRTWRCTRGCANRHRRWRCRPRAAFARWQTCAPRRPPAARESCSARRCSRGACASRKRWHAEPTHHSMPGRA